VPVTEGEVWHYLPQIVARMDDPAADYGIIPAWFVARRARQEARLLLSAEGADEIFAGYGRYRSTMRPWWLGGRRPRATGAFDRVRGVLREEPIGWRDGIAAAEAATATPGRTRLQAAQAADIADWLPNDLLLKLDRCLGAHGLEARLPFLDAGVAAAGFRLPDAMKLRGRTGRWLLRAWLEREGALPRAPRPAPTLPMAAWIAAAGERLGPLVAAQPGVAEVARPDRVVALFRHVSGSKHRGFAAWNLLFYALWHRAHIERLPPEGDTFTLLARRG
jgi:asparagine synthase (glutamine-hydrolysing)